jgi:hypothetical protein
MVFWRKNSPPGTVSALQLNSWTTKEPCSKLEEMRSVAPTQFSAEAHIFCHFSANMDLGMSKFSLDALQRCVFSLPEGRIEKGNTDHGP